MEWNSVSITIVIGRSWGGGGLAAPKCVFFSNINLRKVYQIASQSCLHDFLFLLYNAIIFPYQ